MEKFVEGVGEVVLVEGEVKVITIRIFCDVLGELLDLEIIFHKTSLFRILPLLYKEYP